LTRTYTVNNTHLGRELARYRGGNTVEEVAATIEVAPTGRRTMKNEFMTSTKKAVVQLRNLQHAHSRIKDRADARLRVAQDRHALEISRAEKLELDGWQQLMAIPGMTPATAAAILEMSESTVSRWVARIAKSPAASIEPRAPRGGMS